MTPRLLAAIAIVTLAVPGAAQQQPASGVTPPQAPAIQSRAAPFHLEIGGFYTALSRGYGHWRGLDLKLQYASRRAAPFMVLSSQTRSEGSQQNLGVGSYLVFNDHFYSIVGISHAPDRGVALYPKTRFDAALLGKIPVVRGLVASAGITEFYGANRGGGRILSIGSLYYRGRAIGSATIRFNRDRLSGAASRAEEVSIQYGEQSRYWMGGGVTHGTAAYEVVAAVPFDARFEGIGASLFAQRWISRKRGAMLRYDFEHKYTAYVRHGISLTYFVDF